MMIRIQLVNFVVRGMMKYSLSL